MSKRKRLMRILLVGALVLTPGISAFAAIDESQESEKLYMSDDVEAEVPIHVVITKDGADTKAITNPDTKYAFESDLSAENASQLFEENSKKVAAALNNHNVRTITIAEGAYQLLEDFTASYLEVYLTKNMPDLSTYYNLSSNARKENELLVEAFAYQTAAAKSNKVESVDSTLNITEVTPVTANVDEILFYLQRTLHTDQGDEDGGTWFLAHVANTTDGHKLLKLWIQDYAYEMMQNKFTKDYLSKDVEISKDSLAQDILNEIRVNYDSNLKGPAKSINEPDDKTGDSSVQPRKTTLTYDREAVGKAAQKYAYDYNTLFVAETNDCTNYVSQCMWQSPGWVFDRIGNSNDVKWSCAKNSSGKYKYETLSWVGVNELWKYFQINDSPSQAGTVYGISATTSGYDRSNVEVGDIIQFHNGSIWRHSVIVSKKDGSTVYCAARTGNEAEKPLDDYLKTYPSYRVGHINNFITSY